MKITMRDKVCQLIGKYQQQEAFYREKVASEFIDTMFGARNVKHGASENAVKVFCYGDFLIDLMQLLKEDDDTKEDTTHE